MDILAMIRNVAEVLFLVVFIPYLLFLLTLHRALTKCSRASRTMEPGMVWLMLVPFVNCVWQFFVVNGMANSLDNEFRARGELDVEPKPGHSIGIAMCVCALVGIVPIVNFIAIPCCIILFIIYWSNIAGLSKRLSRLSTGACYDTQMQLQPSVALSSPPESQLKDRKSSAISAEVQHNQEVSRRFSMLNWHRLPIDLSGGIPLAISAARRLNKRTKLVVLISGIVAVLGPTVYWVSGSKVRSCDNLAASPHDQQRPWGIKGVDLPKINPQYAVAACQIAVESKPLPRLYTNLGRAFEAAGDNANAAVNFRIAAEHGYALAQADLGSLFQKGSGVPQSYAEAAKWYRLGAEQGSALAQDRLGVLYAKGLGLQQSFNSAAEWYLRAADQGYAVAENDLGTLYEKGTGVPQSFGEAAKWYRRSGVQGNAWGQNNLGILYLRGHGVAQSNSDAAKWIRRSADQGNSTAQANMGLLYENGAGVTASSTEAATYYKLAAAQGNKWAAGRLQQMGQEAFGKAILGIVLDGIMSDSRSSESGGSGIDPNSRSVDWQMQHAHDDDNGGWHNGDDSRDAANREIHNSTEP